MLFIDEQFIQECTDPNAPGGTHPDELIPSELQFSSEEHAELRHFLLSWGNLSLVEKLLPGIETYPIADDAKAVTPELVLQGFGVQEIGKIGLGLGFQLVRLNLDGSEEMLVPARVSATDQEVALLEESVPEQAPVERERSRHARVRNDDRHKTGRHRAVRQPRAQTFRKIATSLVSVSRPA